MPKIKQKNNRLVWNFGFLRENQAPVLFFAEQPKENIKWERRFFWPDNEPIVLNLIDPALLDLKQYKNKQKRDSYFVAPNSNYNIKRRRGLLLYKPILKQTKTILGFGPKIDLEEQARHQQNLENILIQTQNTAQEIEVLKESFTFTFPTKPSTKLELARLQVHNKIYFSLCIEGRSFYWVETISTALLTKDLLKERHSSDYIGFLNKVITP